MLCWCVIMFSCILLIFAYSLLYDLVVLSKFFALFFFFKQKTAYEMRISDWSSDVCSSDLLVVYLASWTGWLVTDGGYSRHVVDTSPATGLWAWEIGRASCRERVCQYV